MARLPRFVLPGHPHHVTQRGNRREATFFEDGDYALHLDLLAAAGRVGDFAAFLGEDFNAFSAYHALRKAETTGRPVGSSDRLAKMERATGLKLAAAKRGRKPAQGANSVYARVTVIPTLDRVQALLSRHSS
jgi:hypothetical protein